MSLLLIINEQQHLYQDIYSSKCIRHGINDQISQA